jgi:hypothetical protein
MSSRTQPPSDGHTEAAAFGIVRGRGHSGRGLPKYYAIKAVAEALDVSPRTVSRSKWGSCVGLRPAWRNGAVIEGEIQ